MSFIHHWCTYYLRTHHMHMLPCLFHTLTYSSNFDSYERNLTTDFFKFPIVNFLSECIHIPAAHTYGIHSSRLIRHYRPCASYTVSRFLDRGFLQLRKTERSIPSGKCYVIRCQVAVLINKMTLNKLKM